MTEPEGQSKVASNPVIPGDSAAEEDGTPMYLPHHDEDADTSSSLPMPNKQPSSPISQSADATSADTEKGQEEGTNPEETEPAQNEDSGEEPAEDNDSQEESAEDNLPKEEPAEGNDSEEGESQENISTGEGAAADNAAVERGAPPAPAKDEKEATTGESGKPASEIPPLANQPYASETPQPTTEPSGNARQGGNGIVEEPATPAPPSWQQEQPEGSFRPPKQPISLKQVLPIALLLVAAIALIMFITAPKVSVPPANIPSNIPTNTVKTPTETFASLASCGPITKPGRYYLNGGIRYSQQEGACINVSTSNVVLTCNQNRIEGAGPYTVTSPYSYGVFVGNSDNVTITGCPISNFSYGVYASGADNLHVTFSNVSFNSAANLFIGNSSNTLVYSDYLSKSAGEYGSVYITGNSTRTNLTNNTVIYNAFYGVGVNSTNNTFLDNYIKGFQSGFYCSVGSSFPHSSTAVANRCFNNTGCSFVACTGSNIPPKISEISLNQRTVNSCGTISEPGSYQLGGNINVLMFLNLSNPFTKKVSPACITIAASNVTLDCNNREISNSLVAISSSGENNITLSRCRFVNATAAVSFNRVNSSTLSNLTMSKGVDGLVLMNSSLDKLSHLEANGNLRYGIEMANSSSTSLSNFNLTGNRYGLYLSGAIGNLFQNGTAFNNTLVDVYGVSNNTNRNLEFSTSFSCGITDTFWAPCNSRVAPTLAFIPVSSCGPISKGGNYSLTGNVLNATSTCITITASNVTLNCNGDTVQSLNAGSLGSGISINGARNVTLNSCDVSGFRTGVSATNSTYVEINKMSGTLQKVGILFADVGRSDIYKSKITQSENASISFDNVRFSSLTNSNVSGIRNNTGILLVNSTEDNIFNNTGSSNYVGLSLAGSSRYNNVSNNTMGFSKHADYSCSPAASPIDAESGGINYGTVKIGCQWLAALPPAPRNVSCASSTSSQSYNLRSDAVYPYGSLCYSLFANATTVNCDGHTVIATNGGTFAQFKNSQGSLLENCYLKGFTTPVSIVHSTVAVRNDSFFGAPNSTVAINVTTSRYPAIEHDNITSYLYGIVFNNVSYGTIMDNHVNATAASFELFNTTGVKVTSNIASRGDGIGALLYNSTLNLFDNNSYSGKIIGIECQLGSKPAGSNIDNGANSCSSNIGCSWVSASNATCGIG